MQNRTDEVSSKHCFEVADETDEVSSKQCFEVAVLRLEMATDAV
ncbi:hypothetical protein [Streptococcus pneumoniae]|nr:hypothetical protein [Streptococcus pneumoniae]